MTFSRAQYRQFYGGLHRFINLLPGSIPKPSLVHYSPCFIDTHARLKPVALPTLHSPTMDA